ncbi:heme oxygenase (decycling) 1 [Mortierella sp. GBA35]|nr:heme oxygenase (decycling) 1 [Mortierella sp. AD031]KAF9107277.1 heme oxygenase (decycling) 1 [Mortierella sp. GBA35]KAG0208117.1 heme oxygenase (decycling) 1 [Mortierella sp. NVP41]
MTLLAVELKESTKYLHAEAGRSKFMKYFFKGEISPATYGRFLVSLYQVYNALEKALDDHKENPQLALIYFPEELSRKTPLEEDLEFFNGPNWRQLLVPITPAQQTYINAIQDCASSATPERLIAHSYVRYLGDLSGGQVLAKRLQKYNDLPEDKGVAFYHFELIEDNDQFKEMFRKRLNQVEVSDEVRQLILEEAKNTFSRNIDIFAEFDKELVGLPLTRREQEENLVILEKEKAELAAAKKQQQQDGQQYADAQEPSAGFLASFAPSNLWNSLLGAIRYPVERVESVDA